MAETLHEWVSFRDDDGAEWMFDTTFLTSPWQCIFGQGCKGVLDDDASELGHGCCSHGAHFSEDRSDVERVLEATERLTPDVWQFHDVGRRKGVITEVHDGDAIVSRTRRHRGACILLNRPGFEGGAGCALHIAAERVGEHFKDWKPDVCWQLPLRLAFREDENGNQTYFLHEWRRQDWGGAEVDLHWCCTEEPEPFVGSVPVYVHMREEIVALVGEERYEWFARYAAPSSPLPHPAVRRSPR